MSALSSESIYNQYSVLVAPIARNVARQCPASVDLEDLEQIGRMALWTAARSYDDDRAESFGHYARMRIRGAMLDSFKSRRYHEARRECTAIRIDAEHAPQIEAELVGCTPEPVLDRMTARLPPRQAKVIELRFWHDLTRLETAQRLGISKSSVVRAEQAALATMRAGIGEQQMGQWAITEHSPSLNDRGVQVGWLCMVRARVNGELAEAKDLARKMRADAIVCGENNHYGVEDVLAGKIIFSTGIEEQITRSARRAA